MDNHQKNKEQLISELQVLQQEHIAFKEKFHRVIIENRQINKDLIIIKEKYKAIVNNVPVMIYSSNSDWTVK